jgi:ATP-dependent DNA helicase PIF1
MMQTEALAILKTGANVFLTGEPGSGKTYTINQYVQHLHDCGIDPAITASTGIASTHIGGVTIHSWSGIGIRDYLSEQDLDVLSSNEPLVKRLNKSSVLIIDEISMLSAQTLDMIDLICRTLRRRAEAFGGMQVVLVGDFFQLPPISRDHNSAFSFRANVWKSARFVTCYLTEQHRQLDTEFLELLGCIRSGDIDTLHHEILQSCIEKQSSSATITHLYSHNADVDRLNDKELEKIKEKPRMYTMTSVGSKSTVESLKKGCLSPELLIIKPGAVVMCTKNNSIVGYMNGTLGTVTGFVPDTNYPVIKTLSGEKIVIEPVEWIVEMDGKIRARITQIPLRLAWAITVHKSQGMSMDAAKIDLSNAFEYGQGYVALSRVRSLEGLYIVGYNDRALLVHPEVQSVDTMFRERSKHAVYTFGAMIEKDLETMHQRFVSAIGGIWPKPGETAKKREYTMKISTQEQTLSLINEGKTISEIAIFRKLKQSTILDHSEKLIDANKINAEILQTLISDTERQRLAPAVTALLQSDSSTLTPIKELFADIYSYDDLRTARILSKIQC